MVSRRVHQEHAEKHNMSGGTAHLSVVDLCCCDRPYLRLFHVEEAGDCKHYWHCSHDLRHVQKTKGNSYLM